MIHENEILMMIASVGGDRADLPFWEACQQGRFLLHQCGVCRRSYWPASLCVEHGDSKMAWADASGLGEVYTYTIQHRALTSAMIATVPYAVAVVKLEEGPFFHANIRGCLPDQVHVGLRVRAMFEKHPSGFLIPNFESVRE